MIQHTVVLRLNDSVDTAEFLARARRLAVIDGVTGFQILKQIGSKNSFTHAQSMFFDSESAYDGYNNSPDHVAFVNDVWIPCVADFVELDYVVLD